MLKEIMNTPRSIIKNETIITTARYLFIIDVALVTCGYFIGRWESKRLNDLKKPKK